MTKKMSMKEKGSCGEKIASVFLVNNGYKIVENNFWTRISEIDIIAVQGRSLVFFEVKTWDVLKVDSLEYAVGVQKRKKIISASKYFVKKRPEFIEYNIRYDVIIISLKSGSLNHMINAFQEG